MPEYNQVMATPVVVQLNDDNDDNDDNGDSVIDNNDVADVVVVTFRNGGHNNGVVRALSSIDGSEIWDYSQAAIMADASYPVAAADFDFDGDGIDEVIVQDNFKVRVLNGEVLSTVANSAASLWEYSVVVDLQGDDNAELVVLSNSHDKRYRINNGVSVYGADNSKPWKNATRIWNQHSYHQTNISQDGKIPKVEKPSWLNNNTYRSSTIK
jgi:hypothetical protein